jgi:hypothetical protein
VVVPVKGKDMHSLAPIESSSTQWGADFPVLTESLRLHHAGQLDQALALYLWLESRHADSPDLKFNIGVCHQQRRHFSQAIRALRAALAIDSTLIAAHESLGEVLREQNRLTESEAAFRHVLELDAEHLDALNQLASVLKAQMRFDEAIVVIEQALAKNPDFIEALLLLGTLRYEKGEIDAAVGLFRQTLNLEPSWAQAHFNLSQCLLLQGHFKEGWQEHEWRGLTEALSARKRDFAAPLWQGEPLVGKTILLYAEQGLGDTLQFVRYAPLLQARGARVIVECQPLLVRLIAAMPQVAQVGIQGEDFSSFDFHSSLMRLPFILGTELANIPFPLGYLKAPGLSQKHGQLNLTGLGLSEKLPRIGICWGGNAEHSNDGNRSLRLGLFEPLLLGCKGRANFVSLQVGPRAMERHSYAWADELFDATVKIDDFADTAVVIEQLDLVISVDTSVLHLAGTLGRPVWGLLPFVPDSRWLMHRIDSPWYASLQLFRQSEPGDWTSVLVRVGRQLERWFSDEWEQRGGKH